MSRPTDLEAAIIASFTEFVRTMDYDQQDAEHMAKEPFDYAPGRDTILLHKYGADSWALRQSSWNPDQFEPGPLDNPKTLTAVLNYDATPLGEWVRWQTERLDVFATPTLAGPVPAEAVDLACRRAHGDIEWANLAAADKEIKRAAMRYVLEGVAPLLGERPEPANPTRAQLLATLENTLYRRSIDQHYVVPVLARDLADDLQLAILGAERVPARVEA
ncbi:hypothetical protein ACFV9C_42685 [Kribbella sp. NPDC059898]|uniref:hypothetical protein n=1 Tax=Kribbella sp. NPDC059898 TaxID=3346995 RepID=UPI0036690E3D